MRDGRVFVSFGFSLSTRKVSTQNKKKRTLLRLQKKKKNMSVPLDQHHQRRDEVAFKRLFPGLQRSGTQIDAPEIPSLRVICFANAGNAEDLFTNEGVGERKIESPLLTFCRKFKAELLSVQLPGRGSRRNEPWNEPKIQTVVREIAPTLASELRDVPYVVVGHSVGCWLAVQLVDVLRSKYDVGEPLHFFLSNFPAPTIEDKDKPWRKNKHLSEREFQEECRKWDVQEIVFTGIWKIYHPLMRADFCLFDSYENDLQEKTFTSDVTAFHGTNDKMISRSMVEEWEKMTTGTFALEILQGGNHLFPLEKESKIDWLKRIVAVIEAKVMPIIA
jgi:medium-chain acyl-[acyl-carrier-protein] hydrolase